jgi:hypothetical protein
MIAVITSTPKEYGEASKLRISLSVNDVFKEDEKDSQEVQVILTPSFVRKQNSQIEEKSWFKNIRSKKEQVKNL